MNPGFERVNRAIIALGYTPPNQGDREETWTHKIVTMLEDIKLERDKLIAVVDNIKGVTNMTDKNKNTGIDNTGGSDLHILKCLDYRYAITEDGRLFSLFSSHGKRKVFRELKFIKSNNGYLKRSIYLDDGSKHTVSQHRLLASVFLRLDFNNKTQTINHIDGNRENNRIDNLQVMSLTENIRDYYSNRRTRPKGRSLGA